MAVGFKGFGKPIEISDEAYKAALERLSGSNLYVLWCGLPYNWRQASLRSNVLRMIRADEKGIPVPIETLIARAMRVDATHGYDPKSARAGVFLHRGSKPSVYFAVTREPDGSFKSAANYEKPHESFRDRPIKKGDVLLAATAPVAQETTTAVAVAKRGRRPQTAQPVALEAAGDKPQLRKAGKRS